ncbi:MAG: phage head closure protein [Rhodobacteraceae bacterium]|nr:phage head closure protein [Paracoccaceae bacterium]
MGAGRYKETAEFKRLNAQAVDSYGQPQAAFEALFSRKADLIEARGKERIESGAVSSVVAATLRIRYSTLAATLTSADMVTVRGNDWQIRAVIEVGRKSRQIEMLIERGAAL